MQLDERDAAYLWDMREAAKEILSITHQTNQRTFLQNRIVLRATERCLEIIGEAAGNVSQHCRATYPDIPWHEVIGQRNILAHEYGQIDHNILYRTANDDIPELIEKLDQILRPMESEEWSDPGRHK